MKWPETKQQPAPVTASREQHPSARAPLEYAKWPTPKARASRPATRAPSVPGIAPPRLPPETSDLVKRSAPIPAGDVDDPVDVAARENSVAALRRRRQELERQQAEVDAELELLESADTEQLDPEPDLLHPMLRSRLTDNDPE